MNATQGIWEYEGMRRGPQKWRNAIRLSFHFTGIRVGFGECGIERKNKSPGGCEENLVFWRDIVE